jgi:regulator of replication initiation timing
MLNELNALENKIAQVVTLYRSLRSENDALREQLTAAQAEREILVERMAAACARLDLLVEQLPEAKS